VNPAVLLEPETVRTQEIQNPATNIRRETLPNPRGAFSHRRQVPGDDQVGLVTVRAPIQSSEQIAVGLALLQQAIDGEIDLPAICTEVVTAASRNARDRDEGAVLGGRQGEHVTAPP
jgi:hypothetical protein